MLQRLLLFTFLVAGAVHAGLPPGRPLADIAVSKIDGKKIELKQYRGKALVVVVFSTTCDDCAAMIDFLKRVQAENASRGLQVVAAAVEADSVKKLPPFIANHTPNFPIGYLDLEPYRTLTGLKPKQAAQVPILLFIDPKGMIRVQFFADDPLMKKPEAIVQSTVRELLKELPQPAGK